MASPAYLTIAGALLCGISGLPVMFPGKLRPLGRWMTVILVLSGAATGLTGALICLLTGRSETFPVYWTLPFGPAQLGLDPLSALFLLPIFAISACCSLYGDGYWRKTGGGLEFFFGLLVAALALLVLARNGVFFLLAWEIMALSNYMLIRCQGEEPEVCEAGKTYLVATHVGTLALFAMFSLLKGMTGSFQFQAAAMMDAASLPATAVFITALIGFGMKAGLMPLHVWLPSAHANAPSHVSALMSGVVIKMGIYGLIRTFSFFTHIPLWWGVLILIAGIASGVGGVIFAIAQHDIKRLLAYHSIENIGIIAMGIGVALIGQSIGDPPLMILGMSGALLHVLNHAIFKSLLFLGAGGVIHACGTRILERMGGVARAMPYTHIFFVTGAVAISGLPPLNGFVSEFLIYMGLFTGITGAAGKSTALFALAIPSLALIGGLAAACFLKVCGAVFLGDPREESPANPHESGWRMLTPMGMLALLCLLIGIFPAAAGLLELPLAAWAPALAESGSIAPLAALHNLTIMNMGLAACGLIIGLIFLYRLRAAPAGKTQTWGCGYLRPDARMQYTASSFAQMLAELFAAILRPRVEKPALREIFPRPERFESHTPEVVLELAMTPLFRKGDERLSFIRRLQQGQLHLYILYVFLALLTLLAWAAY